LKHRRRKKMSAFMPHFAPVVVLLFLGSLLLMRISVLLLFYGAVRCSVFTAKLCAGAAVAIAAGYLLLLSGVSFASSEETLPPGGWKYFCEIDCHLAYSLAGAQTAASLGPEMQQVSAHGKFAILRVKTWFDEHSIFAHRGNGPLTPNRRKVLLVDDTGRRYEPSPEGESAFSRVAETSTPLTQPLRPGESYTTDSVFDVPQDARRLRLLITEDEIGRSVV